MRVLVIPDVHLKYYIFDFIEEIPMDSYDKIVFIGDIVDDWGQQYNDMLYDKTLVRLQKFLCDHETAEFCYGNHDLSYRYGLEESGFSYRQMKKINDCFYALEEQYKDRIHVILLVDDVVFSHAGLTDYFVHYNDLQDKTIDEIVSYTNLLPDTRDSMYALWNDASPIWVRPQMYTWQDMMYKNGEIFQVFGHTPTKEVMTTPAYVSVDVFSTTSKGEPFGSRDFIIIDTKDHSIKSVRNDIIGKEKYDSILKKKEKEYMKFLR